MRLAARLRTVYANPGEVLMQHNEVARGVWFIASGAVEMLQAGQVSDPVKTPFGWHVLQLREVREGRQVPFEDVRDELLADVARRGFDQFEAALTRAWDDGRPDLNTAFDRLGKAKPVSKAAAKAKAEKPRKNKS